MQRKTKYAERGCLTGQGTSVKEAKKDLEGQIDRALAGTYCPAIVKTGEWTAVVYREPSGWYYRLLRGQPEIVDGITEVNHGSWYEDRDAAIQAAGCHVLDLAHRGEFHEDSDIPAWLTDSGKRGDLLTTSRFQRAWEWAKANRPEIADNSHELHRWACDHSRDVMFD